MEPPRKNILITGFPGVGKTVLLRKLLRSLPTSTTRGFYTEEIREGDNRVGFSLTTVDGRLHTLAHVRNIVSPHRVGRYKVDVQTFERVIHEELRLQAGVSTYVVDEIGKMECLSSLFCQRVIDILDSDAHLIATIAAKGTEFVERIKKRSDVDLFRLTRQNRDSMLSDVLQSCGIGGIHKMVRD